MPSQQKLLQIKTATIIFHPLSKKIVYCLNQKTFMGRGPWYSCTIYVYICIRYPKGEHNLVLYCDGRGAVRPCWHFRGRHCQAFRSHSNSSFQLADSALFCLPCSISARPTATHNHAIFHTYYIQKGVARGVSQCLRRAKTEWVWVSHGKTAAMASMPNGIICALAEYINFKCFIILNNILNILHFYDTRNSWLLFHLSGIIIITLQFVRLLFYHAFSLRTPRACGGVQWGCGVAWRQNNDWKSKLRSMAIFYSSIRSR